MPEEQEMVVLSSLLDMYLHHGYSVSAACSSLCCNILYQGRNTKYFIFSLIEFSAVPLLHQIISVLVWRRVQSANSEKET